MHNGIKRRENGELLFSFVDDVMTPDFFIGSPTMPESSSEQIRALVPGAVLQQRTCDWIEPNSLEIKREVVTRQNIDQLVLKTLAVIRLLVDK